MPSAAELDTAAVDQAHIGGTSTLRFARRWFRSSTATFGALVVLILLICAGFAPIIAPYSPIEQIADDALQPPSRVHLLGTDTIGRDYLSRLIFGARISLLVGAVSMSIASIAGVTAGLVAGYNGGLVEAVIMRIMDALLAF